VEVGIPSTHPPDAVLAHENGEMRKLPDNLRGHAGVRRDVGTKMLSPGEASSAATKSHADDAFHGRRITRG